MEEDEAAYRITIDSPFPLPRGWKKLLKAAAEAALQTARTPSARIGIRIMTDADIATLNERHLGHPGPTDVITFPLQDDAGPHVEGDIALSIETARREAQTRGHAVERELALYAVHGVLHLLGFDDRRPDRAACMHRLEDDVLDRLGLGRVFAAPPVAR